MTEHNTNSGESFQDYFNNMKRFVCCRTARLGWQNEGYVLFSQQMTSAEDGAKYPGTVWVEDNESKYQPGDVVPHDKLPENQGNVPNDGHPVQ